MCLTASDAELKTGVRKPELHAGCSGRWTWKSPPVDEACRCPCDHPNLVGTLCWECWHLEPRDREILRRLNARGAADELHLVPMGVVCSFGWICTGDDGVGNQLISAMFHSSE